MNAIQILNTCQILAASQGSYGRLYEYLKTHREALEYLVSLNFKDSLDMVMFLEAKED